MNLYTDYEERFTNDGSCIIVHVDKVVELPLTIVKLF